jgi:hypothetical protein
MTPHRMHIENFDLISEFEFICKKALAPQSGAQDGCFNEKTEGEKFRDTVPLIKVFNN